MRKTISKEAGVGATGRSDGLLYAEADMRTEIGDKIHEGPAGTRKKMAQIVRGFRTSSYLGWVLQ